MIPVFIGFDARENIAFHVLSESIHSRASQPVSITPVSLSQLGDLMWRKKDALQSTDFSFSRFLVPYLSNFNGWAIFMDCDMLVLDDIAELWKLRDDRFVVQVVKHDHQPKETTKFLGTTQTTYEKKNWSSVMLFNCAKCTILSPEYVNTASGLDLHRFNWLESEELIGEIPHRWNHLVAYDAPVATDQISNLHYTIGGPYFNDYKETEYAKEWFEAREAVLKCE